MYTEMTQIASDIGLYIFIHVLSNEEVSVLYKKDSLFSPHLIYHQAVKNCVSPGDRERLDTIHKWNFSLSF